MILGFLFFILLHIVLVALSFKRRKAYHELEVEMSDSYQYIAKRPYNRKERREKQIDQRREKWHKEFNTKSNKK